MVAAQSSGLSPHLQSLMGKPAIFRIFLLTFPCIMPLAAMSQSGADAAKHKEVCRIEVAREKISAGHSIAIRLLSIKSPDLYRRDTGQPFYTAEPLETLRLAFAEKLRSQLQQTKSFSAIVITPDDEDNEDDEDDEPPQTDLVLEGEFTAIYQLGGKVQLMAYPVTRMAIKGQLKWRETSRQVVEFSCLAASEAGLINRPKKQMHNNIEKITDGLKALLAGQLR